jgi:hypothetical protein
MVIRCCLGEDQIILSIFTWLEGTEEEVIWRRVDYIFRLCMHMMAGCSSWRFYWHDLWTFFTKASRCSPLVCMQVVLYWSPYIFNLTVVSFHELIAYCFICQTKFLLSYLILHRVITLQYSTSLMSSLITRLSFYYVDAPQYYPF